MPLNNRNSNHSGRAHDVEVLASNARGHDLKGREASERPMRKENHGARSNRGYGSQDERDCSQGQMKTEWPEPFELPDTLLPVSPFDFDLLPDKLRPWVADVSDRMQCPPDFVAASVMPALGSLIGRKLVIRPKANDDWQVHANLWTMLIGRPGVLKSPAMQEALRPLRKLVVAAEQNYEEARAKYKARSAAAAVRAEDKRMRARQLLKENPSVDVSYLFESDDEDQEPTLQRYLVNDTTVESLGVLLQQNPNGLLVYRDELVSLLDSLDDERNISARGFYLTGWSGDSDYTFDRIGRGLHLRVEGICISILGSAQPGRIAEYLGRAVRVGRYDDGLTQRFNLLVWPDINASWSHVDRRPDKDARNEAYKLFLDFAELNPLAIGATRDRDAAGDEQGIPYLRFGQEAYDRFVAWQQEFEPRLRAGDLHPALESHLAKYRKLVPAIALICHIADGGRPPVGLDALDRALAWARYLESHARRAYGAVISSEVGTAKVILAKIKSGHLKSPFGSRDVWRPGWSKLADPDAVRAGLKLLVDYDWLRTRKLETAGRPGIIYEANPKAVPKL